jgi:hypothetical protein
MHQEEGFKFCLDTKNNRALPLDPASPEHLSVRSPAGLPYVLSTNSRKTLLVRDFTGHKEKKQSRYVAGKTRG